MKCSPRKISIKGKEFLNINWNDGTDGKIKLSKLRRFCPCADCGASKENSSDSYYPIFLKDQTTIESIKLMGNYAVNIWWKDGHNTGIYDFNYLKNLEKSESSH